MDLYPTPSILQVCHRLDEPLYLHLLLTAIKRSVVGFSSYTFKSGHMLKLLQPHPSVSSLSISNMGAHADAISSSHLFTMWTFDTYRQYVPLVVIFAVIIDIICGSPLANLLIAPMRKAANSKISKDEGIETSQLQRSQLVTKNLGKLTNFSSPERIDTVAIAAQAIDKARNTMELRKYLEENKTDKDRMEDLRKKIDSQLRAFDE